jgi:4-amino-4-deoxy-L-arabinose transferase-like glycosyltransferase
MPRPGGIRCPHVNPAVPDSKPFVRWLAARKFGVLCSAILAVMAVNLVSVTLRKSVTTDEIVLIPAAYYHLVANEVHLIAQHPPLCKLLAGAPLLFVQPNEWKPEKIDPRRPSDQHEWDYVMHFWQDNRASFETICFWSRLPMILLTLALGLLLFVFARDLFGPRVALLSVLLFAIEPAILAHGRIVQTDIPASFGLLLSVFALTRYLRAPGWKRAYGVGAGAAVAMIAKYSMLIIGPVLLVVFTVLILRQPERRALLIKHAVLALLALLLVINASYFFYYRPLTEGDLKWVADCFPASAPFTTGTIRVLRLVLPTDFVMGIYWQLHHSRVGHPAGLLGMYGNHGWWYYFPVAFVLKATIPFVLVSASALIWAIWRFVQGHDWRWAALLIPFLLYTALMLTSPIDIGVRYYLPGYVFLFILSAAFLEWLLQTRSRRSTEAVSRVAVIVAVLWMGLETWRAYPNYIPYMNQLAYARPHWWYLSDSNIEWGDDARELANFLHARGEARVRGLLLGCFATLDFYRVNYVDALSTTPDPPPRYTAIGASFLNGSTVPPYEVNGKRVSDEVRVNTFDSFRHRKPEAVIGNSIYVFRTGD